MDTEKWMPVEGYGNKYEVSNLGRIKSYHKKKPKILLIHYNTNGYPYVNLHYNKTHKADKYPNNKKIICEGKIFYNIKEVSGYYGINYSTLCCWLNGTSPMPKEWKKKGLGYYGK